MKRKELLEEGKQAEVDAHNATKTDLATVRKELEEAKKELANLKEELAQLRREKLDAEKKLVEVTKQLEIKQAELAKSQAALAELKLSLKAQANAANDALKALERQTKIATEYAKSKTDDYNSKLAELNKG